MNRGNPAFENIAKIIEIETGAENVRISMPLLPPPHLIATSVDTHSGIWGTSRYKKEIPYPRVDFYMRGKKYFAFINPNFDKRESVGPFSSSVTYHASDADFVRDAVGLIRAVK